MKPARAIKTALLPQYQWFETIRRRFHEAIHDDSDLGRSLNKKGIKEVDSEEIIYDALAYFTKKKAAMEAEFHADLCERMDEVKVNHFCEAIANHWYNPGKRLQSRKIAQIKSSVRSYIIWAGDDVSVANPGDASVNWDAVPSVLNVDDVTSIVTVNYRMIIRHMEAWKETHPNWHSMSSDDIFLRRGVGIDPLIDTSQSYREWDYINSYSLAFSASEKFAQMKEEKTPILINGDIHLFDGRVLFFSPFVPGMGVGQLEAGIISGKAERITYQGEHGGIHEYILGEGPWLEDGCVVSRERQG